jgi:hypothetical protein
VIDHVPQRLVAGEAELDDPLLLAAPLRDWHGAGLRLQMPKRRPPPRGIPRRAHSVGAVMPCLPIGSVRAHCAAGMLAKKSSIASR